MEQGGRRAVAWTGTAVLASAGFGGDRRQRSRSAGTISIDGRFQVVLVIVHHHQIAGFSALFGAGRRCAVRWQNSAVRRVDQAAAAGQIVVAIATVASVTTPLVVGSAQSTATRQGLVLVGYNAGWNRVAQMRMLGMMEVMVRVERINWTWRCTELAAHVLLLAYRRQRFAYATFE